MVTLRLFHAADATQVGFLIADTFADYNLAYATPEERQLLLGPFRHARSTDPEHQAAIAQIIQAAIMLVAVDETRIVGVLRGRTDRLQSLFVDGDYHRQGIGKELVAQFEQEALRAQTTAIRVASSLYAVPFYLKLGYKKTTGMRTGACFDGDYFPYQPMIKRLRTSAND